MKRNGFCFLVDNMPSKIKSKAGELKLDTRTSSALAILLYLKEPSHSAFEQSEYIVSRLLRNQDGERLTVREALDVLQISEEKLSKVLFEYLAGAPKAQRLNTDSSKQLDTAFSSKNGKTTQVDFDYVQDSPSIISAMRQEYKLSVEETKNLHWWEFLALFDNLSSECSFSKIVQIRKMKIDPKASPERKAELKEAKKTFGLIDTRTPEQKEADRIAQFNALEL